MASDNETVEAAISAVRKMIHDCPAIKGGLGEFEYQLKANGAIDRIEAAHGREVDALNFKLMTAKSEQKTAANVIIEQTNKAEKLQREVETARIAACSALARFDEALKERDVAIAELRECLRDAVHTVCYDCDEQDENGCLVCHMKCAVNKWRKALGGEK